MPAICQTCGTVFPGVSIMGPFRSIDNTAGPCPRCGNMGSIPDGAFHFLEDSVEIIESARLDIANLNRLLGLVNDWAKNPDAPSQAIAEEIGKTVPGFDRILSTLPQNRIEWYGYITMIATILMLVIAIVALEESRPSQENFITQIINTCGQHPPLPPIPMP